MRYFVDPTRRLVRTDDEGPDGKEYGYPWEQVAGWQYDEFRQDTKEISAKVLKEMRKPSDPTSAAD